MGMRGWLLLASLALAAFAVAAEPPGTLRVGTSGDYPPWSRVEGTDLSGFDMELAAAYANDRGLAIELHRFEWPRLLGDLAEQRFDVAMSGITVRPERSAAGRFSVPLHETGAVALVGPGTGASNLTSLDSRGTRIGVNAGGHLERVARNLFSRATLVAIPDNHAVLAALREGRVDAVLTDSTEAPRWHAEVPDAERLGPLTRDRKALLVHPARPELARDLDAWLMAREADGTLERMRRRHFGPGPHGATAAPDAALVAALDERLALMPSVAAAKREDGRAIVDVARERRVLDAAVDAFALAAEANERPQPEAEAVRAFVQAQMDAAKAVQLASLRTPERAAPPPRLDLVTELRPALLRIGERIAQLAMALPPDAADAGLETACRDGLRSPWLDDAGERGLCAALLAFANARDADSTPAGSAQQRASGETGEHR